MREAIELYRQRFSPSRFLDKPYVMLGFTIVAADSNDEAEFLASSLQRGFVNLRRGQPGKLQPPEADYLSRLPPADRVLLSRILSCSAIGDAQRVKSRVEAFLAETRADELMIASQIYDHRARLRSYEIVAQALIDAA